MPGISSTGTQPAITIPAQNQLQTTTRCSPPSTIRLLFSLPARCWPESFRKGLLAAKSSGVKHTFYGYPDNDPPESATAYNCGGRNFVAGGTGTYADPLTMASAQGEFNECEIVGFPSSETSMLASASFPTITSLSLPNFKGG